MCGIAGLALRDPALEPNHGAMLTGMLTALGERGPDSAGVAIYERFAIGQAAGYQAVGHTRMATESAVTKNHCHPFVPADGVCVVHNGSFSNHATIRRRPAREGIRLHSANDTQ